MKLIVKVDKAIRIAKKLKRNDKKLVVAGGCFDILHVGHVIFLEKAKKRGDVLMVLLESDKRIQRIKGENRPVNKQADRAKLLSALQMVDVVVCLPDMKKNEDYNELVENLKPNVIAITGDDKFKKIKSEQVKKIGGRVAVVTKRVGGYSTSGMMGRMK